MLRLIRTDTGQYDLAPDDGSEAAAVETLVIAALLTDAEAPTHREPDRYHRRGWWAEPLAGTGLWYVRRQALSAAARREAIGMVRTALLRHGLSDLSILDVTPVAGNVSSLLLEIAGQHDGRQFVTRVSL